MLLYATTVEPRSLTLYSHQMSGVLRIREENMGDLLLTFRTRSICRRERIQKLGPRLLQVEVGV
jgi:hypothetical protein